MLALKLNLCVLSGWREQSFGVNLKRGAEKVRILKEAIQHDPNTIEDGRIDIFILTMQQWYFRATRTSHRVAWLPYFCDLTLNLST